MQGEEEAIVERISTLIERGESPQNVGNILRETGWPQINGKDISNDAYAGFLTISIFNIQDRMRKSNRLNLTECRAQLWDLSKSYAFACLASGQLKYVADALKVMGAALSIEPPKKKVKEVPNIGAKDPFATLPTDELQKIVQKNAEGSA